MKKDEYIKRYGEAAYQKRLVQNQVWVLANPEKDKERKRAWYAANCEKVKKRSRRWKAAHPEKAKEAIHAWRVAHPENVKKWGRTWQIRNCEKRKEWDKKYTQTEKGKATVKRGVQKYNRTEKGKTNSKKRDAKRRGIKFVELNDRFIGSEGHHLDKEFVVFIPKEMHRSVWHNVFMGKNMEKINALALDFVYGD